MVQYSDVARLLNIYQLWLDDLYPRAKFADGLAMIEKLGHKKSLQIMRKEWINEGKPRERYDDLEAIPEVSRYHQDSASGPQHAVLGKDTAQKPDEISAVDEWSDDDIFGPHISSGAVHKQRPEDTSNDSLFISGEDTREDAPPEDDLDALLAEDEINAQAKSIAMRIHENKGGREEVNFDDEMEVIAGLDDMW